MARNIGPTVDLLERRVRQLGGGAVDNDFAAEILTTCQQIANIALRRVITTETLTTLKEKLVYSISSDLTNSAGVVSVSVSATGRELFHCKKIEDFGAFETNWFRNITATRFEAWHQVSRDYLIIYPGKASNSSVYVESIKATTISTDYTTDYNTALELPDEDVEVALKLAEAVLLLRARNIPIIKTRLLSLAETFAGRDVQK